MFNPSRYNWDSMIDIKTEGGWDSLSLSVDLQGKGSAITSMALLKSRVLTSLARRGFCLDNSTVVGPPIETDEIPKQFRLDEIHQKQLMEQMDDVKKIKAKEVWCNGFVCVITYLTTGNPPPTNKNPSG